MIHSRNELQTIKRNSFSVRTRERKFETKEIKVVFKSAAPDGGSKSIGYYIIVDIKVDLK